VYQLLQRDARIWPRKMAERQGGEKYDYAGGNRVSTTAVDESSRLAARERPSFLIKGREDRQRARTRANLSSARHWEHLSENNRRTERAVSGTLTALSRFCMTR